MYYPTDRFEFLEVIPIATNTLKNWLAKAKGNFVADTAFSKLWNKQEVPIFMQLNPYKSFRYKFFPNNILAGTRNSNIYWKAKILIHNIYSRINFRKIIITRKP